MKPIVQPTRTTCGQTCVAMLAGVTVEEAIVAVGTHRPTDAEELIRGLAFYGLSVGVPRRGAARGLAWIDGDHLRVGHWVVAIGGCYIDPADGRVYTRAEYEAELAADGMRVECVFPVRGPR